jgi:phosphoglycerol transferase MdoB-like AlkP superfamily enzyme
MSKNIKLAITIAFYFLCAMMLYRLFFFFHFKPVDKPLSGSMLLLGLRFDIRVVAVMAFVIWLFSLLFKTFIREQNQKFITIIISILFFIFVIIFISDFYHYDYLQQRLSASVLSFGADAAISAKMMWQTYPVFKIVGLIFILIFGFFWLVKRTVQNIYSDVSTFNKRKNIVYHIFFFIAIVLFTFGKIGQYPLRWSDAFTLSDDFKANTALNPIQSFLSTYKFKNATYDLKKVKEYYPLLANYLGVKDSSLANLNFDRVNQLLVTDSTNKPNVVIVICESFSAYKSSMFGNGLNATPYFNSLCNQGVFFERCFTPAFGTARGVWATLTGIPDVENNKTASRNPTVVNQQTIMNQFNGFEKFYFLGGSTTWANIRGVLTNNISGLKIYEEENFKAAKVDVWGISDKNLFLEANKVLAQQTKPFVSIIQTADNHRPYTIPTEDLSTFKKVSYSKDTLDKYGFDDNAQLNAFRYTDFCFKIFIEAAKKEKYFNNTIFVFVGDHGLRGNAGKMFPQSFTSLGILAQHVPLLFYAPNLLKPKRDSVPASQLDIFPSVAFLAKQNVRNTSLGINLFDTAFNKKRMAFIADPDLRTIGILNDSFYWRRSLNTNEVDFQSIKNDLPVSSSSNKTKLELAQFAEAYYQTAKYLLLNNKKK